MVGQGIIDNILRGGLRGGLGAGADLATHFGDDAIENLRQVLRTTDDPQTAFNDWMDSELAKVEDGTPARQAAEEVVSRFRSSRAVNNTIIGLSDTSRYLDRVQDILSRDIDQADVDRLLREAQQQFLLEGRNSTRNISPARAIEIDRLMTTAAQARRDEIARIGREQGLDEDQARAIFLQREAGGQAGTPSSSVDSGRQTISQDGESGSVRRLDPDEDLGPGLILDERGNVIDNPRPRADGAGDPPPPRDGDAPEPDTGGGRADGAGDPPPPRDGDAPEPGGGGRGRAGGTRRVDPFETDPNYRAPESVIPDARRNILQQAGRLHYTNWSIPFTNIRFVDVRSLLKMERLGTVAKNMPNFNVRSRFIAPVVEAVDTSIRKLGVTDVAKQLEDDLSRIARDLSNNQILKADAIQAVRQTFDEFAGENAEKLAKLREHLAVRIEELESRTLVSNTPNKYPRGMEDLSLRQQDAMLKYLRDLDKMAKTMAEAGDNNEIMMSFIRGMDGAASDGRAAEVLENGTASRIGRFGSDVDARLTRGFGNDALGIPRAQVEDLESLERGLHGGYYNRETRFDSAATLKDSNNAELHMGRIIDYFKKKELESPNGRVKWDVEDYKAIQGYIEGLYDAGYPQDAMRAIQVTFMYMGKGADEVISSAVLKEINVDINAARAAGNFHREDFYRGVKDALNDLPHSPLEFGPRDMQRRFAEISNYIVYGKAYPGDARNVGGITGRIFGQMGVPGEVNQSRFIWNKLNETFAYFTGGRIESVKAEKVGQIPKSKISWDNVGGNMVTRPFIAGATGLGRVARDGIWNPSKFVLSGGLLSRSGPIGLRSSDTLWSPTQHVRWSLLPAAGLGGIYYAGSNAYEALTGDDVENNGLGNLAGFTLGVPDIIASTGTNAIDLLLPGSPLNDGYEYLIGRHIGFGSFMGDPAAGATPPPAGGATPPPAGGATPPPAGGATPPPAGGATPPPAGGATPPPAAGATPPPAGGATPPPAAGATPPPAAGATPPPAGGATPPPAGGATPPPAGGATPPPAAGATPPPAGGATPPPAAGGDLAPSAPLPAGQTDVLAQQRAQATASFASIRTDSGFVNSSVSNPGSEVDGNPQQLGAQQMVEIMEQNQRMVVELIDELTAEGETARAQNLYPLRDAMQRDINTSRGLLAQSQDIQRETQDLMRQADEARLAFTRLNPSDRSAGNVAEAERLVRELNRIQRAIGQNRTDVIQLREQINNFREENVTLLYGDSANPDRNGNAEFQHRYGNQNAINEGLRAAGGGEYGILSQFLGTDRPGGTSVVGGYAQAGMGWLRSVGDWWERTKNTAKTQDERNFYNLLETGGVVVGGLFAINMINSITGNKMPPAMKWALMIGVVAYALNRSGRVGQDMRDAAEQRAGRIRQVGAVEYGAAGSYARQSNSPAGGGTGHTPDATPPATQTALITDRNGNPVEHIVMSGTSMLDGRTQSHVGGMPIGGDEIQVGPRERAVVNEAVLGRARMMGMGNNLVDDARRGTVDAVVVSPDGQARQSVIVDFTIGDARAIEAEMATAQ